MQSHSSPALSPSNSSSLLQYLHTAFHTSPEVDRRVGLPLSNVPTPNPRSPQLQPVDGDQLGIPELNSDSMGTPAVLTPRLLDVSSMELSNSGPELKASDSELKPTSADEIDRSSGNLNLALTEIKQLIKVYSKKLAKAYKARELTDNKISEIEKSFVSEKNEIYEKHDISDDMRNKSNRVVSEHFSELLRFLKEGNNAVVKKIIRSLKDNFI